MTFVTLRGDPCHGTPRQLNWRSDGRRLLEGVCLISDRRHTRPPGSKLALPGHL